MPVIKKFVHAHPAVGNLLSGVLATAALKMFMAFLPTVLHFIITTTLHLKAGSIEQLKLQQWSTAFLLLFVVLVTSLGRGLTITFVIVMQDHGRCTQKKMLGALSAGAGQNRQPAGVSS